jgi:TorA maturation chaperone TorD
MTAAYSDRIKENRAKLYSTLSLFFLYPSPDRLAEIAQSLDKGKSDVSALSAGGYSLISHWDNLAAGSRKDMEEKYTHLFISGYPTAPCLPYGSVYLEQSLYGGTTESFRKIIGAYHLSLKDMKEPADHIAVIMEFISYLIIQDESTQKAFDYLNQWVWKFLETLKQHTTEDHFYHRLAVLTDEFLRKEIAG